MTIEYRNERKVIKVNEARRVITNKDLNYSCIEKFDKDNIKDFFRVDENITNINSLLDHDVFILQYTEDYGEL